MTQSTVEWAMTEVLANPKKMTNAKNELSSVIGEKKQTEESDISRLTYLQALIKETLRLHPPGPFLVPRWADREDEIGGGSDMTQSTVEWAMTEVLANPKKMTNAKNELSSVIGEKKQTEESDISRLTYLQALIKETLRLHPPGPFLVP
ncbi:hypothetical protein SASPL_157710 [Salvia splendens]|uniref:Uncharacterized protein n=1 Tax=Salvia splendens TaxID=180675 RepID=A0A8X8VUI2_SALSN|nr:geraniol 8-hydroxylase-like [Salvia splendens]KAG6382612.1 hypothetical protein SASPL_157710 [Salvia splendens]